MDIISMQIANKVLKRMNTEFNGLYDIVIATEGQNVFTTTKAHDIENHGLHVYVNGYHAVEEQDYTHTDQNSIEFKNQLRRGDVILMSTQIVGIPKFEVNNPEYDDTSIKAEILSINGKITAIINALDEDADGSIIDTIADIKKQWKDADSNLVLLIEQKASAEEFAELKTRVDGIIIPPVYNDEALSARVEVLEDATTKLEEKVSSLELDKTVKGLFINDEETGRQHEITLRKGVLLAKAVGLPLEITQTGPAAGILNRSQEFKLNIMANTDLNQKVKLIAVDNKKVKLEFKNKDAWELFEARTIESLTNLDYTLRVTGLEIGQHVVKFDIIKFDNSVELGTTSFSINVAEPPHSIISGTISLDEADASLVSINIKESNTQEPSTVTVQEGGAYTHKLLEAGTYTVSLINNADTHDIQGDVSKELVVELGKNYENTNFALVKKAIPVPTEQERVVALLQDSTTSEIVLGEDITIGDVTLGCNKALNLNGLNARLDGATNVGTFKITSTGGGAVYFDSGFTLTGDGEGNVIIDNSENSVSYRMGTLPAIQEEYGWVGNIFKKNTVEPAKESGEE